MDSASFIRALLDDVARPTESETARPGGLSAARAAEWRAEFGMEAEDIAAIEADLAREANGDPFSGTRETGQRLCQWLAA